MEQDTQAPTIRETEAKPSTMRLIGDVGELFTALAKAQAEFTEMDRDAQVKFEQRMFKYATLAEVLASVRPALNKYGLALLQPFDGDKVTTILAFGSARFEVDCFLPEWKTPQILGSALTYVKRYQVKSILGVNDGEDDDGNEASGTGKTPEPRTRANPPAVTKAEPAKADPNALTPQTKARIGDLGKAVGFNREELEAFAIKHKCGALASLNEVTGLLLVTALDGLKVQP